MIAFRSTARHWIFAFGAGLLIPGVNFADRVLDATPFEPLVEVVGVLKIAKNRGRSYFSFLTTDRIIKCDTVRCHNIGLEKHEGEEFRITIDQRNTIFSIRNNSDAFLGLDESSRDRGRDTFVAVILILLSAIIMAAAMIKSKNREEKENG